VFENRDKDLPGSQSGRVNAAEFVPSLGASFRLRKPPPVQFSSPFIACMRSRFPRMPPGHVKLARAWEIA
jgi:hypothetical protein